MNPEDDEIQLISIMSEQGHMVDKKRAIQQKELDCAIHNALGIGPIMDPLIKDLKEKGQYDDRTKEIEVQSTHLVKALYSNSFLSKCPEFVSGRETLVNIKLITATIMILRGGYLAIDDIRHGLNAYILTCRENKDDFLYLSSPNTNVKWNNVQDLSNKLDYKLVHKALRLVNKSISEKILKMWTANNLGNIEWNNPNRRDFEKIFNKKRIDIPFIMPHEFLFLLCNCMNRV